ncbi:phage tail sheath family protein [Pseudarthrobacter sulfonivorans]|uniref:phage tail sheath family protein n=1 Tax=Pseudarthrobacter sulfonivorans TaxID=121292 RepID=UPI002102D2CB|nr:phage tail sheath subtilisin-like domain-containing protein [Pseudarthrobacter sulfonivorans]
MPEYLTPGVYLEETSFRSKSIEGVSTSTFGMAGLTKYGPVPYVVGRVGADSVIMTPKPTLVSSFTEFERAFGGLDTVGPDEKVNYLAYAARAFFGNGGRRLYVARVFNFSGAVDLNVHFASLPVPVAGPPVATWRARWPGEAGRKFSVEVSLQRSKNILVQQPGPVPGVIIGKLQGVTPEALVETFAKPEDIPTKPDPATRKPRLPVPAAVKIVRRDAAGALGFYDPATNSVTPAPSDGSAASHLTVTVTVTWGSRVDVYPGLEVGADHPRSISKVLQAFDPVDEFSLVWLDTSNPPPAGSDLLTALLSLGGKTFLSGGNEGASLDAATIAGEVADPDDVTKSASGLEALAEIDDIAIVSSPNAVSLDAAQHKTATDNLIQHCEARGAYRIGIIDPPADLSISDVRSFRSQFDSTYAALYYPWVKIVDPTAKVDPTAGTTLLDLPPSGFTAGIYARNDIQRGVHKAPANEVVLGMTRFVQNVTYDRQSVLNPEGINALRFFEGRANRVWGARTVSSDPEWKYVNVRRLFIYLEHSIDKSTQWAVFEPNNERLWASIRQSIEDFLLTAWRTGALMGTKPEEAFFVRCDRTTMTQNDLDNGRLICLIGVAPTYPAEFVIFRIGQWTADAQQG